jgi:nucleotide-binding universal stress UspA family protein
MPLKALIPLDGSAFSRQVLPYACRLLSPEDYRVTLLHVAPVPEDYGVPPPRSISVEGWSGLAHKSSWDAERARHPHYASQVWESFRAALTGEMAPEETCLQHSGFEVLTVVRFGEPAQEIADFVEEEDIDLVIMATHGRSGLGRLILGSVAEKVLRSLRVPVLMVRPAGEGADETLPITIPAEEA